jgi:hypothetical protein
MKLRSPVVAVGILVAVVPLGAQQRTLYSSDVKIGVSKDEPRPFTMVRIDVKGRDTTIVFRQPEPMPAFRIDDYLGLDEQQLTAHMASRDTVQLLLVRLAQQRVVDPSLREWAMGTDKNHSWTLERTIKVIDDVGAGARQRDYELARMRQILNEMESMSSGPSWDAAFIRTQYFLRQNEIQVLQANFENAHDKDLERLIRDKIKVLETERDQLWNLAGSLGVSLP